MNLVFVLVPQLYCGTHLRAQLHCAAARLYRRGNGNEVSAGAKRSKCRGGGGRHNAGGAIAMTSPFRNGVAEREKRGNKALLPSNRERGREMASLCKSRVKPS